MSENSKKQSEMQKGGKGKMGEIKEKLEEMGGKQGKMGGKEGNGENRGKQRKMGEIAVKQGKVGEDKEKQYKFIFEWGNLGYTGKNLSDITNILP